MLNFLFNHFENFFNDFEKFSSKKYKLGLLEKNEDVKKVTEYFSKSDDFEVATKEFVAVTLKKDDITFEFSVPKTMWDEEFSKSFESKAKLSTLKAEMQKAVDEQRFEDAAKLRDKISELEKA